MKHIIRLLIAGSIFNLLSIIGFAQKQDTLPYREMPAYPDSYTAANMTSRMVDGLGFRFYWATEGLREKDLAFRPTAEARNVEETIDHILLMSFRLLNAIFHSDESPEEGLGFNQKRALVLSNFQKASDRLRKSNNEDFETYVINLSSEESLPFWNFLNGQIADCIWHCGQLASFRRLSGNPFNPKVSLLMGKVRE